MPIKVGFYHWWAGSPAYWIFFVEIDCDARLPWYGCAAVLASARFETAAACNGVSYGRQIIFRSLAPGIRRSNSEIDCNGCNFCHVERLYAFPIMAIILFAI